VLLPYLTTDQEGHSAGFHWSDGVQRLWHLLEGEAESRWGIDRLSLDSLRLETATERNDNRTMHEPAAYVAQTYRAGWHFDAGQALAWAVLELQASCAEKVIQRISLLSYK
jgi:ataxia telangiectasia mutated family protein